ncbi:MAG: CAP domain-containing protein, partial [Gemmataceae bacterium]
CADLVESAMDSFHFRLRVLDPDLKRVGFGHAKDKGGRTVSVVDVTSGVGLAHVQFYPVDKQKDVTLAFQGNEVPDPIPDAKQKVAGFPITVLFPWNMKIKNVRAKLFVEDPEAEVEAWVSTPEKPLGTGTLGNNMIYLIAKEPLKPGATYRCEVTADVNGKSWKQSASFSTRPGDMIDSGLEAKVLQKVNAFRKNAGLDPVVLNAELSKGCLAHAQYLSKNNEFLIAKGHSQTVEDPKLSGFTEEGNKAGKGALIGFDPNDPTLVIDYWMGLYYSRFSLLDPLLKEIGFSAVKDPANGWTAVLARKRTSESTKSPLVFYPADQQTDVPLAYTLAMQESPDPIPESKDKQAGFPITALFPDSARVKDASGLLLDEKGKEVPAWFSSREQPVAAGRGANALCLIAKHPLEPKTTYTVTLRAKVNDEPWKRSWSFTTEDNPLLNRELLETKMLEKINAYRKILSLTPVKGFDPVLSKGCQAHAEYLVKNSHDPSTAGLGMHNEDPKLPGYSKHGERAGKNSVIASVEPLPSIDSWMATPFHRRPFLNPDLKRIGLGFALGGKFGRITVLDTGTGVGSDKPIIFPGEKQRDVPLAYLQGERPDPIPGSDEKTAGYPVTVTFPASASVKQVTAVLKDAGGKEHAFWLSSPERPFDPRTQRNTVCLIAKAPLKPSTAYTVTLKAEVNGTEWKKTWSFVTAKR